MRKTLLTIDGFDAIFEGYVEEGYWNGWSCPWFTQEVANEIMRVNNKVNGEDYQMQYERVYDMFVREEDGDEPYMSRGYDIEDLHLYPIGNSCWIWDDLANYQTDQSKMLMEYLREEYFYLNCEQLHDVYYGILQEINGYMTDKEVKIFADGFMAAYDRRGK